MRLSNAALRAEQDVTQWGGRDDGRRDDGFWEVERIIKVASDKLFQPELRGAIVAA